jgi:ATP-dependent Clp protease ATP-binding subunit ClpC
LSLAHEEAQRSNHNHIGTEHILLGLVRETEGVAVRVLSGLGVNPSKVRSRVEFIIGHCENPTQGEIGLTPRAKKVVELAVDEVRRTHHSYIGTEHLLIGLLREGEEVAAGVLESLGITLEKVRGETQRVVSNATSGESRGPRTSPGESQGPLTSDRPPLLNLARLEGNLEEISQRFTSIDHRLAALENTLNSRFDALESRMAKLEQLLQNG